MRPLATATHQRTRACRLRTNADVAKKRPQTLAIQRFRHSDLTAQEIADRLAVRDLISACAHCNGWPLMRPATKIDGRLHRARF